MILNLTLLKIRFFHDHFGLKDPLNYVVKKSRLQATKTHLQFSFIIARIFEKYSEVDKIQRLRYRFTPSAYPSVNDFL